jgi:hypothetical protein
MKYISRMYMVTTHSGFIKAILVVLVILSATIFANFWFTVVAYAYNTKSNGNSSDLYTSTFGVGSSDDKNLLTVNSQMI